MMRILVLHALLPDSRQTTIDHVLCYLRHLPEAEVVFHHLHQPWSRLKALAPFDAVVLNYCFLMHRQTPQFETVRERYQGLAELGPIAAIPQDDYMHHERLDDWFCELGVGHVWSPLYDHRDLLYPRCSQEAEFHPALTGYVEASRLASLEAGTRPLGERPIDLGTRVRMSPFFLGRFARKKGELAEALQARLAATDLVIDISTRPEDSLPGPNWLRFLQSCRFVVGQRGGASLTDPDGRVRAVVDEYLAAHPEATFDEVEAACFPGRDGRPTMTAVSPRLLEAAATRTCQILLPDDYLGLEPWRHYIPLEEDLSNLDEVVAAMGDLGLAERLADACYDALISSGTYSYRAFAREVVGTVAGTMPSGSGPSVLGAEPPPERGLRNAYHLLGADLYDVVRRWLQRARHRGELDAVTEILETVAGPDWVDGSSSVDAEALLPALRRAALDGGLLVDVVSEIDRCGATEACLHWVDALRSGRLGERQLHPWVAPELFLDPDDASLGRAP